jgi:hypothetical protein
LASEAADHNQPGTDSGCLLADTNGHRFGTDAGSPCQLKGTEMHISPAIVGALSALLGAIIGAAASLAAAIYTQRYQNRLQRVAGETSKRETVYAEFIMSASSLLLKAYVTEGFKLNGEEQHLIGVLNRMRLFAPPAIVDNADAVIRRIIEISLQPSLDLKKHTVVDMAKNRDSDLLLPFSQACRVDLDNVYRTIT